MNWEQPWARIRDRVPVTNDLDAAEVLALDDDRFADLVCGWLLAPPGSESAWRQLWRVLAGDDDCAERTLSLLEQLLDTTEAALAGGGLDDAAGKRARKFAVNATSAFHRVDNVPDPDSPLGWAGRAGRGINRRGAVIIDQLVNGIAAHRAATINAGTTTVDDEVLWKLLGRFHLDPDRA